MPCPRSAAGAGGAEKTYRAAGPARSKPAPPRQFKPAQHEKNKHPQTKPSPRIKRRDEHQQQHERRTPQVDAGAKGGKIDMSIRTVALAALSGLLLASTFPHLEFRSYSAWIALVPLLIALQGQSRQERFSAGRRLRVSFISAELFTGSSIPFIFTAIYLLFPPCSSRSCSAHIWLCIRHSSAPALFSWPQAAGAPVPVAAPALWTALELARTYVFSGFPWALLGYSQYRFLPVIQISDITGVYGVSFLMVLVNAALAQLHPDRKKTAPLISAAVVSSLQFWLWLRSSDRTGTPGS